MIQAILVFAALLLLSLAIRIREETWYSPFSIFALLWTFIVGFSLFTAPEYFFSAPAIGFITICVFVFYTGGYIAGHLSHNRVLTDAPVSRPSNAILTLHVYLATFAGFLSLYFLLHDAGVVFTELFKRERLVEISKTFTNSRYTGERLSPATMLCMMIAYSGCLTAGRQFVFSSRAKDKIKSVMVLVPVLLFTVIYTARAVFVFALLLFVASLITHYVLIHRKRALLFSRTNLVFMLLAFVAVPLIFILTQAVRMGITKFSPESLLSLLDHLKVWFSGNVSAFSYWYEQGDPDSPVFRGAHTFAGLNEWLGGKTRDAGIYSRAYDLDGHFHFSNIYTLFRFMIDDFGKAGTLLGWFGLGMICRFFYQKILNGDFISAAILSGILTWLLFSFVTSVFAYNTVLFSWMIFVVITFISEKLVANEK